MDAREGAALLPDLPAIAAAAPAPRVVRPVFSNPATPAPPGPLSMQAIPAFTRRVRIASAAAIGVLALAIAAPAVGETTLSTLGYRVVDAEYSAGLERIVMVSHTPPALRVHDPLTAEDLAVPLPLAPTSVSVAPDGLYAAVGHDGWVSYVDLRRGELLKSIRATADVFDLVLAGNGFIYVFPAEDQWVGIHVIEIATGSETLSAGRGIYEDTHARLHPSGAVIYGATNGGSPTDIEKYSIATGTAEFLYDSPYHGEYPMCGNLWIAEDGLRIFTACGRVFRSSGLRAEDMRFGGRFRDAPSVRDAVHSSEAGQILVVANGTPDADRVIQIYDEQFLARQGTLPLPDFVLPSGRYGAHARFVFFNGNGSRRFAIVEADAAAGGAFAVVTFDGPTLDRLATNPSALGGATADAVTPGSPVLLTVTVSPGTHPASTGLSAFADLTTLGGAGSQPMFDDGTHGDSAAGDLVFSLETTVPAGTPPGVRFVPLHVKDAQARSTSIALTVTVAAPGASQDGFAWLKYRVLDAEYSAALEKIVMVSEAPPRLHVYDPIAATEKTVLLPAIPTSVSVAPDGLHAAVGHDRSASYVDLQSRQVLKTTQCPSWPAMWCSRATDTSTSSLNRGRRHTSTPSRSRPVSRP